MTESYPWDDDPDEITLYADDKPERIPDGYALPTAAVISPASRFANMHEWPEIKRAAREAALRDHAPEFVAPCGAHGLQSLFDTGTAACLLCLDSHRHLPVMAQYKAAGASCYVGTCPVHGETRQHFGGNGCSKCRDARGRPLGRDDARGAARSAGASRYIARCAAHGEVEHYTATGHCSSCRTTAGLARSTEPMGRPGDPARIAARRARATTYLAPCDQHGEVPHHTIRGKCLTCYTSLGYPRLR